MALIDKLRAIADGFRSSRGTTQEYSLDDMATLAAEPVGGSGDSEWEEQFARAIENDEDKPVTKLPESVTRIGSYAFYTSTNLALTELHEGVTRIGDYAFQYCTTLSSITFKGKPSKVQSNSFGGCSKLLTINVPWAEGEVANAPWGATNATINYNYTGG